MKGVCVWTTAGAARSRPFWASFMFLYTRPIASGYAASFSKNVRRLLHTDRIEKSFSIGFPKIP